MANETTASSTNLNASASPGGDGVQSSASERAAAGDKSNSQGAQQRINAAERRERGENTTTEDKKPGGPAGIVQSPGEVMPNTGPDPIDVAEQSRKDKYELERKVDEGSLPQSTLDEINAGRAAIQGNASRKDAELNARKSGQPTNPVDETSTTSKG
jgi:hypothetical protein